MEKQKSTIVCGIEMPVSIYIQDRINAMLMRLDDDNTLFTNEYDKQYYCIRPIHPSHSDKQDSSLNRGGHRSS